MMVSLTTRAATLRGTCPIIRCTRLFISATDLVTTTCLFITAISDTASRSKHTARKAMVRKSLMRVDTKKAVMRKGATNKMSQLGREHDDFRRWNSTQLKV